MEAAPSESEVKMRKIQITVGPFGEISLSKTDRFLGYGGEHKVAKFEILFDFLENSVFADSEYFRIAFDDYYSDALVAEDRKIIYLVPFEAVNPPLVQCQIVGYKTENGVPVSIAKSSVFDLEVKYSKSPGKKFSGDVDVFERTLGLCEVALEGAREAGAQSEFYSKSAEQHCDEASLYAKAASDCASESAKNADVAEVAAEESREILGTLGNLSALPDNVANSVKCCVKGDMIAASDVSPIEHSLVVKSDSPPREQNVTLCDTGIDVGDSVEFNGVAELQLSFMAPATAMDQSYLVPIVNGEELEAAKVFMYSGEFMNGIGEISYKIIGDELLWSGWTMSEYSEGTWVEVSGKTTVDVGALITGFSNLKTLTETNLINLVVKSNVLINEGATVTAINGNMLPFARDGVIGTVSGVGFSLSGGELHLDGEAISDIIPTSTVFSENFALSLPCGKYWLSSFKQDLIGVSACILDGSGATVVSVELGKDNLAQFEITEGNDYYFGIGWKYDNGLPLVLQDDVLKVMLTAVEPICHERSYPIQIAKVQSDGVVNGLKATARHLNVFTSLGNVSVEYNQDINKIAKSICEFSKIYSNALKGSKSGIAIEIDDASPIKHELSVKLSSDELTDFSHVKLCKYGKNLISYPYNGIKKGDSIVQNGVTTTCNQDGSITINGTVDKAYSLILTETNPFVDGVTYTLSGGSYSIGALLYIAYRDETGTVIYTWGGRTLTWSDQYTFMHAYIQIQNNKTFDNYTIYPMAEIGTVATEYEPYIEPTCYSVKKDGNVEGVLSQKTGLSLMTDTKGVIINVEYNRDINKAFMKLQNAIINLGGVLNV